MPGWIPPRMGKAGAHAVAEAHAARDLLDERPGQNQVPADKIHHAIDRGSIPGRAFALHPWTQPVQHGLRFEGQGGVAHKASE